MDPAPLSRGGTCPGGFSVWAGGRGLKGLQALLQNNAVEVFPHRECNNLKVCLKNDSSQGQNLALTVLYVPYSLDSGFRQPRAKCEAPRPGF